MARNTYVFFGWLALSLLLFQGCAIFPCRTLSESSCRSSSSCSPLYGPSSCSNGNCTADISYKGCEAVPEATLKTARKAYDACKLTPGAAWSRRREAKNDTPRTGRCVCVQDGTKQDRLEAGQKRMVVAASAAGMRSNDGRQIDRGAKRSADGKAACLRERDICQLNGGSWTANEKPTKRCSGVTLLRVGDSGVVVDTRARQK